MTTSDYRFVRSARWIAGHVIAIAAVVGFVLLGLWQLARLDDRRDFNDLLSARGHGAAMALPDPQAVAQDEAAFDWQLVELVGTYLPGEEIILQARTLDGLSGHDVLTPLDADGRIVIVDRGWVPIDVEGPPVIEATPPSGTVTISGVLRRTQVRGTFGPTDPATGALDRVSRVDLKRLEAQVTAPLYPMWVQLLDQTPAQAGLPKVRPLPPLDEGPHLSYAVQWFVFAGVVLIGYPILLRRTAQRRG